MSYQYKSLNIEKLSVIGAGQIGPDICLHFAKVFVKNDVAFVIVDISEEALGTAKAKIEKKINKGVETGAFKPEMAEKMKNSITYTTDYNNIAGSAIVLEAATEDERIKDIIFKQVEAICDDNCLFFSNSSHMEPEVIFILEEGREVVHNNCIRCHSQTLTDPKLATQVPQHTHNTQGRVCWDCHREVPHGRVNSLSSVPNARVPVPSSPIPDWMKEYLNETDTK